MQNLNEKFVDFSSPCPAVRCRGSTKVYDWKFHICKGRTQINCKAEIQCKCKCHPPLSILNIRLACERHKNEFSKSNDYDLEVFMQEAFKMRSAAASQQDRLWALALQKSLKGLIEKSIEEEEAELIRLHGKQ